MIDTNKLNALLIELRQQTSKEGFEQLIFEALHEAKIRNMCVMPILPYLPKKYMITNFPDEITLEYRRKDMFFLDPSLQRAQGNECFLLSDMTRNADGMRTLAVDRYRQNVSELQRDSEEEIFYIPLGAPCRNISVVALFANPSFSWEDKMRCKSLAFDVIQLCHDQYKSLCSYTDHIDFLKVLCLFGSAAKLTKHAIVSSTNFTKHFVDQVILQAQAFFELSSETELRVRLAAHHQDLEIILKNIHSI